MKDQLTLSVMCNLSALGSLTILLRASGKIQLQNSLNYSVLQQTYQVFFWKLKVPSAFLDQMSANFMVMVS